jgi:hypothetical protein
MAGNAAQRAASVRSRLILSAWFALSTCFRKIMWPANLIDTPPSASAFTSCDDSADGQ